MTLLHHNATKQSVDFIRFWIFGIWFFYVLLDPFQQLSELPGIMSEPKGLLLKLFSENILTFLSSVSSLWMLKIMLLISLFFVLINQQRFAAMVFACILLTLWQSFVRNYGHVNHSEVAMLQLTCLLTFLDGINPRIKTAKLNLHAATLIILTFFLSLPYLQIGIHRLVFGQVDVYTSDSLLFWIFKNSNRDSLYPWHLEQFALKHDWLLAMLKIGFPVTTIFEILAPFALISKWVRYAFFLVIVPFHFLSLAFMKIFFWENTLLFVLLLDFTPWVTPKPGAIKPVVFFDGVCGLCNKFVDWLIRRDVEGVYSFASLQSNISQGMFGKLPEDPNSWSIIFKNSQGTFRQSEAVIRILTGLGGAYIFWNIFRLIPLAIRDRAYHFIAVNRYRWFGKRTSCRLPSKEERQRFIS